MRRVAILLAGILLLGPAAAAAQDRECAVAGDRWSRVEEAGQLVIIFTDPFVATCADGTELRANTGRLNEVTRELQLDGDVFFQDTERTLTSDRATYSSVTERLWAAGNVDFVNRVEGSTLRGPELEYFRANEERPESQVFATLRPTLTLPPRDSGQADAEPLQLVADRIVIIGDDDLSAFGTVVVTRTGLEATSEEATYDSATESLELRQNAVIRDEEQELAGDVINAELTDGSLEFVHSRSAAALRGTDLEVTAPDIQLFFTADTLQRVTALVPDGVENERAIALSRTFRLEADSIDAFFVDQLLDEVHAIGTARGETVDTMKSLATGAPAPSEAEVGAGEPDSTIAPGPPGAGEVPDTSPASGAVVRAGPDSTIAPGPLAAGERPRPTPPPPTPAEVAPEDTTAAPTPGPGPSAAASRAIIESDWIRGDTILAFFEPAAPDSAGEGTARPESIGAPVPTRETLAAVDSLGAGCALEPCPPSDEVENEDDEPEVELRRLIAVGDALSLYRLAGDRDPPGQRSNVNLLAAERIELDVVDGELEVATATGLQRGIYLEANVPPPVAVPPAPIPGDAVVTEPAAAMATLDAP